MCILLSPTDDVFRYIGNNIGFSYIEQKFRTNYVHSDSKCFIYKTQYVSLLMTVPPFYLFPS